VAKGNLKDEDLQRYLKAGEPIAGKADGGGLTFTLSPAGTASWIFRYRFGGRQRELTLGNYPDVSLKAARIAATAARAKIDAGIDVASEKRRSRSETAAAKTFRQVAEDYLSRATDLAAKTQREARRYLDKDLLPRLGSRPAREIGSEDVVDTVEAIGKRSDPVARHAFELLSVIFAHALARSAVKVNPCAGLRLSSILGPRPARRARLKLTAEELRTVLSGLQALGPKNALIVKVLMATCVRKGELIRAKKADLDFSAMTWLIPAENSKTGKGFVIPLAPTVAGWFRELIAMSGTSQWVLPKMTRRGRMEDRQHMSDKTLNAALARCPSVRVRNFTPHDLRSTARSHMAALGVDLLIAERCLNHSLGGLVAVYDQHDYLDERRAALEKWANLLVELETGKPQNVVPLRAAA
jgi:integrase